MHESNPRGDWAGAADDYARALAVAPVDWRWHASAREGLAPARERAGTADR